MIKIILWINKIRYIYFKMLTTLLKVANGAKFDIMKITGASLLFQAFQTDCFENYIVCKIN